MTLVDADVVVVVVVDAEELGDGFDVDADNEIPAFECCKASMSPPLMAWAYVLLPDLLEAFKLIFFCPFRARERKKENFFNGLKNSLMRVYL